MKTDKVDINASPKRKHRLLKAIQKARLQLTSNDEIDLGADSIIDGEDFSATLTRDEFAKIN